MSRYQHTPTKASNSISFVHSSLSWSNYRNLVLVIYCAEPPEMRLRAFSSFSTVWVVRQIICCNHSNVSYAQLIYLRFEAHGLWHGTLRLVLRSKVQEHFWSSLSVLFEVVDRWTAKVSHFRTSQILHPLSCSSITKQTFFWEGTFAIEDWRVAVSLVELVHSFENKG